VSSIHWSFYLCGGDDDDDNTNNIKDAVCILLCCHCENAFGLIDGHSSMIFHALEPQHAPELPVLQ